MTAPASGEASPVERVYDALATAGVQHAQLRVHYANIATIALLAGDWLERVLDEHTSCKLAYRYGEDGSVSERLLTCGMPLPVAAGAASFRAAHQAAAIRAAAGVGL